MRFCTVCKYCKPFDEFPVRKCNGKVGIHPSCKQCERDRRNGQRWADIERWRAKERLYAGRSKARRKAAGIKPREYKTKSERLAAHSAWAAKNKHRILWAQARRRAAIMGLDFNIDPYDVVIPDTCPILKKPIHRPSLDRVDNRLGYVKGNVAVISMDANRMKSDHTIETLKRVIEYIESHAGTTAP